MKYILSLAALLAFASEPLFAQHTVSLSWVASADAVANPSLAYNVYRAKACTGGFTKLNTTPITDTGYSDPAVLPGSYCYQVTSSLSGVEGGPSNQAAVLISSESLQQQKGCQHRGNLLVWLRCVASVSHGTQKTQRRGF